MGKKKIAMVDLSQSDTPQLKATGVRSQKIKTKKKDSREEAPQPMAETAAPVVEKQVIAKVVNGEKGGETATKKRVKHPRSKRYLNAKKLIDKAHFYPLDEAVKVLREASKVNFDSSVELHVSLTVDKLSGEISLPHGSGKTLTIEIASEKTLTKLNDGRLDFDLLIAEPKMMSKLAKYAKLLGPKGLMPNPKNGTITDNPEAAKKKMSGGAVRYKSENKAPLIHLIVGKLSFKDSQLIENVKAVIDELKSKNLKSVHLTTSMGPSVKLEIK
jgi:large subunit ribosomal protein L1